MQAYSFAAASEPKLSNPMEVQGAIRGHKVGKAPGPDGIPNRALKHLPLSTVSLLVVLFNAILQTQYFPVAWKHPRVFSILKPGKDTALPLSYRPTSLLDTIGKLLEKILLSRIFHEVSGRGLLLDEQFGLRPKHSTAQQLVRLVERVSRKYGENRLTGPVFLDVAKAKSTPSVRPLVCLLVGWLLGHTPFTRPMKMEPTEVSETSTLSIHTPGNYPKKEIPQ
jgi:hypothetical protein